MKLKTKCAKSFLLVLIITFTVLILFNVNSTFRTINFSSNKVLISQPDIAVNTPQNKTYTKPMSGYYPGTFGFENDLDGNDPVGWVDSSGVGSDAQVFSSFQRHDKVIRGYDGGGSSWKIENNFSKTEGTIELWWAVSSVDPGYIIQVSLRNSIGNLLFAIGTNGIQIRVYISTGWTNIPGLTTTANTWDHLRIDFRSDTGNPYGGLNTNEFRLYYNGIDQGIFSFFANGDTETLRLYSGSAPSGYYGYYDAIGYSWDPSYNIGDNYNEGLLLSFDQGFTPDWLAYSLDGQINKTILGNFTFAFPSDGVHSIQVFGNNSLGTKYSSIIRYFSIDTSPPIITPPLGIPGYDLYILITLIGLISLVILKRKDKKNLFFYHKPFSL